MRAHWLLGGFVMSLSACGDVPERETALTEGQQARAEVDAATQAYAACVLEAAGRMPVAGELPGALANDALEACPQQRSRLAAEVQEFHRIGNPSRTPEYSAAVAEASVKTLESGLREQAVIAVAERQAEGAAE